MKKMIALILFLLSFCYLKAEAPSGIFHQNFKDTITLDLADNTNTSLNMPFQLPLDIEVIGKSVSIHIPAFNFTLPVDGYIFTEAGFLPRKIWPGDVVPQAFSLKSDQTGLGYDLYVTNAGSLLVYDIGGGFLPAGSYTTHATTVTYLLTPRSRFKAPPNIRLSQGTSNATIEEASKEFAQDFQEFYDNSIVKNKFAVCWPDNSIANSPNGRNHMDWIVRTGTLNTTTGKIKKLNDSVTVFKAPYENFFFLEGSVVIDPFDTNHLFATATAGDLTKFPNNLKNLFQVWRGVSFDGGKTWKSARLDGTFGLPKIPRDGIEPVFDDFGNLWIAYIYNKKLGKSPFLNFIDIVYAVSTDGGLTFKKVGNINVPSHPKFTFNFFDYPRAAFGGDGQGGKAFWVSFTHYFDDPNSPYGYGSQLYISYIPVTGKGEFGKLVHKPIAFPTFPPFPGFEEPEITVSPDGKVYLVGYSFDAGFNNNHLYLLVNPTGIVNLNPISFGGRKTIAFSNVGKTNTVIPFQPNRNLDTYSYGITFDPDLNRLYVGVVDMQPDFSGNMTLSLIHTDDDGQTWSIPRPIANTHLQARGEFNMSRDPFFGNMLFSWFDARNQKNQANVNTFMGILTKSELDQGAGKRPLLK